MTELRQHFGEQVLCGDECNTRVFHLELFHKYCLVQNIHIFISIPFFEKVPNETSCVVHSAKESAAQSNQQICGVMYK